MKPSQTMPSFIRTFFAAAFTLLCAAAVSAADSPQLDKLQGKWEVKKTNDQGQKYTQMIEFKKDKLIFKIVGEDGNTVIFATGDVKAESAGPLSIMKITNIQAGGSEDSLNAVDDERTNVYQVSYGTLTMASNMDKERDTPPVLDVYKKVSAK